MLLALKLVHASCFVLMKLCSHTVAVLLRYATYLLRASQPLVKR